MAFTVAVPGAAACDAGSPAQLLDLVNTVRREKGLAPVAAHPALDHAAGAHAAALARRGVLDHTGEEGSDPGTRARAAGYDYGLVVENLAAGMDDAHPVLEIWLARTSHRSNLLRPRVRDAGIACARGTWVLMLARQRGLNGEDG